MRTVLDIKYGDFDTSYFDLYLPDSNGFDLVIWFHGGGLEKGSRKSIKFAEDFVNYGIAVASVEYRMYPNAKFPDFIIDAANSVKFITDYILRYGKAERIFISGQSAGAYITMMLALNEVYLENAGVSKASINGFISDSSQMTTHFNVLRERGLDSRVERIDEAAPLFYLNEDTNVNNLLILYYSEDMYCRPEQTRLFYKSIIRFSPKSNIKCIELKGGHCNGSSVRNERGTFDFCDELIKFIKNAL